MNKYYNTDMIPKNKTIECTNKPNRFNGFTLSEIALITSALLKLKLHDISSDAMCRQLLVNELEDEVKQLLNNEYGYKEETQCQRKE